MAVIVGGVIVDLNTSATSEEGYYTYTITSDDLVNEFLSWRTQGWPKLVLTSRKDEGGLERQIAE